MKMHIRKAMALAVVLVLAGFAGTASATLDLTVDVEKYKTVYVDVDINIDKTINIDVVVDRTLEGAAEAMAMLNVENKLNSVAACEESCELIGGPNLREDNPDYLDERIQLDAMIQGSVSENSGIVGVNQDVGNMANQANVVSFAVAEFVPTGSATPSAEIVSDAQAEIDQVNKYNWVEQYEVLETPEQIFDSPDKTATIDTSINNNSGLIGVNQNSGNMNNQSNGLALAVGLGNAVVLSEAALGQENKGNRVQALETVKVDLITGSVNTNTGVVQVNQSSGNMNNQGSAVAFGALQVSAAVGVPGS